MKISGYICASNAVKLDYCFREAALSLIPVCDEVLLSIGPCDDGTMEIAREIEAIDNRVRVVEYPHAMPVRDIHWWVNWLNHARKQLSHPMQLTLDADEILDPMAYEPTREAAARGECRWYHRINLWQDIHHTAPHGRVCGEQVVRLGPSDLWMPSDEPHPEGEPEIRQRAGWPPNAEEAFRIIHLGFLRDPKKFTEKIRTVNGAFFGGSDDRVERAAQEGVHWSTYVDHGLPLLPWGGTLPEVAHQWLRDRGHLPAL